MSNRLCGSAEGTENHTGDSQAAGDPHASRCDRSKVIMSNVLHDYIAGAIGGCAGIVVGHPFETIKVQLQTRRGADQYKSIVECVRSVQALNLSKGFFRGLSWPLLSYGCINSVYFGVYGTSLTLLGHNEGTTDRGAPYYLTILAAGCLAGVAQVPVACPVESIKVLLQSEIPHLQTGGTVGLPPKTTFHKGPLSAAGDILRNHGPKGLYRAFGTQFCRDVPASGVYMTVYELLKDSSDILTPSIPSQVVNFLAGGMAGVASWTVILPLDVVKSRLQADPDKKIYQGLWDCARKSYRGEGVGIFFRGGIMMALRAFPVNGVTLMVYSECLVALKSIQDRKTL